MSILMFRVRNRVVETPDGVQWRVGRLWVGRPMPRWRKVHVGEGASEAAWNVPIPDVGSVDDLGAVVVIIVGALAFVVVLIPLLLFGIELIILGLLVAAGILGRGLLGRPWVVSATPTAGHGRALAWKVTGLRRSARVIDEVATSLSNGLRPVPGEATEALPTETSAAAN